MLPPSSLYGFLTTENTSIGSATFLNAILPFDLKRNRGTASSPEHALSALKAKSNERRDLKISKEREGDLHNPRRWSRPLRKRRFPDGWPGNLRHEPPNAEVLRVLFPAWPVLQHP